MHSTATAATLSLCLSLSLCVSVIAMNARIVGCGEVTLVLAHGYGGSQEVWDKVLPNLSQRYRVLLFDWNFSGAVDHSTTSFDTSRYSSLGAFSNDLISLLDEMKLKGVVFVGHSMSGMIGCIASIKRPDLFTHLVLVGASPRYLNSEGYIGGLEQAEVENMLSSIEYNFQAWAEGLAMLAMGANGDLASTEKFVRGFQKMHPEIALFIASLVFLGDQRDVLEKVEVPCTIIQGTDDPVVPVLVAYYMQRKIKGEVSIEIFESEGHFPQLTASESLIHVLDKALMPKKW